MPRQQGSARDETSSSRQALAADRATFDFGGQLRLRYEHDSGFSIKSYDPGGQDDLLLARLRLDLAARLRERLQLVFQLQDARALLTKFEDRDFPASNPLEDTFDIRQMYFEWLRIGDGPLGIRLGRQQISYGDQRVFGPGNWGNTGRYAWDAALLKIDTQWFWMDLWAGKYLTYKAEIWPNQAVDNPQTYVGYAHVKNLPARLELFYVLQHDRRRQTIGESGSGALAAHTFGLQAEGKPFEPMDAALTVAAQRGRHGADKLRAYGVSAKVGATASRAWQPRLGLQYTWGSGDEDPGDGIHGTFDGVCGGRDIFFYGYLNLFFWANLRDAQVDFRAKPTGGSAVHVEYHRFRLAQPRDAWYTTGLGAFRRDPLGTSGTHLGDELDVRVVTTLGSHLEIMSGFGRFSPGSFVKSTGPVAPATWFFVQTGYSW